jgi:hypothetical protein
MKLSTALAAGTIGLKPNPKETLSAPQEAADELDRLMKPKCKKPANRRASSLVQNLLFENDVLVR